MRYVIIGENVKHVERAIGKRSLHPFETPQYDDRARTIIEFDLRYEVVKPIQAHVRIPRNLQGVYDCLEYRLLVAVELAVDVMYSIAAYPKLVDRCIEYAAAPEEYNTSVLEQIPTGPILSDLFVRKS